MAEKKIHWATVKKMEREKAKKEAEMAGISGGDSNPPQQIAAPVVSATPGVDPMAMLAQAMTVLIQSQGETQSLLKNISEGITQIAQVEKNKFDPEALSKERLDKPLHVKKKYQLQYVNGVPVDGEYQNRDNLQGMSFASKEEADEYGMKNFGLGKFRSYSISIIISDPEEGKK